MSDPELAEFRARLRDWLEESLPHRWRDIFRENPMTPFTSRPASASEGR